MLGCAKGKNAEGNVCVCVCGGVINVIRATVFANWYLSKLGSYPFTEIRRQGSYLS